MQGMEKLGWTVVGGMDIHRRGATGLGKWTESATQEWVRGVTNGGGWVDQTGM